MASQWTVCATTRSVRSSRGPCVACPSGRTPRWCVWRRTRCEPFAGRVCGVLTSPKGRRNTQHENIGSSDTFSGFCPDFRFSRADLWETLERGLSVWRVEVRQIFPLDAKACDIRIFSILSGDSMCRSKALEGSQDRAGAPKRAVGAAAPPGRTPRGRKVPRHGLCGRVMGGVCVDTGCTGSSRAGGGGLAPPEPL